MRPNIPTHQHRPDTQQQLKMTYPSYFLSSPSIVATLEFQTLWTLKLLFVVVITVVTIAPFLAGLSQDGTGITNLCFITFFIFYSMAFVWRDAYADATYGTLITLWVLYSCLVPEGNEFVNTGVQVSRDIVCYLFVFWVEFRSYISANLTRMKMAAKDNDYRFIFTSVCFDPRNSKFYQDSGQADLDANPSILGVFSLAFQRAAELVLPVVMILPAQGNGLYNSSVWLSAFRVCFSCTTYIICDRLFASDDRLQDCNVQAIAIPTFMALFVNPFMLPITVFNWIGLLILAVKTLPSSTTAYNTVSADANV